MGALNLNSRVLWYAESNDVMFMSISWLLGDVPLPFFENPANFLMLVAFDG